MSCRRCGTTYRPSSRPAQAPGGAESTKHKHASSQVVVRKQRFHTLKTGSRLEGNTDDPRFICASMGSGQGEMKLGGGREKKTFVVLLVDTAWHCYHCRCSHPWWVLGIIIWTVRMSEQRRRVTCVVHIQLTASRPRDPPACALFLIWRGVGGLGMNANLFYLFNQMIFRQEGGLRIDHHHLSPWKPA